MEKHAPIGTFNVLPLCVKGGTFYKIQKAEVSEKKKKTTRYNSYTFINQKGGVYKIWIAAVPS